MQGGADGAGTHGGGGDETQTETGASGTGGSAGAHDDAGAAGSIAVEADAGTDAGGITLPPGYDLDAICDAPRGTFGSCDYHDIPVCNEAVTQWGTTATAICIVDLGDRRSAEACPAYGIAGRCYYPTDEYWSYFYSGRPAQLEAECASQNGLFCRYSPGITAAHAEACTAGCIAARPDYTDAPECDAFDYCVEDCHEAVAGLAPDCAQCVTEQIDWPPGGCNDFECQCPGPEFPTPSVACPDVCQ